MYYTLGFNKILFYFFVVRIAPGMVIGTSFSWLLCPFYIAHHWVYFFFNLFISWHYKMLWDHLYIAYSSSRTVTSPWCPHSFYWRNQNQATRCVHSIPLSFIPLSIPLSFNLSYLFILYWGGITVFLIFQMSFVLLPFILVFSSNLQSKLHFIFVNRTNILKVFIW